MRNRLIHAYFDINRDIVWKTVKEELPALVSELEIILPSVTKNVAEKDTNNAA